MCLPTVVGCRGQALVEVLVVIPAMLALWIAVSYLGRLHDLEARTIATSRYAAFAAAEAPVDRPTAQTDGQAAARVIAPNDAALHRDDAWSDSRLASYYDPLWLVPMSRQRLLQDARSVMVSSRSERLGGGPGGAVDAALSSARAAALLGRGSFDLANNGLLNSRVELTVAAARGLPAPLDALELRVQAQTSLLANAWGAASTEQTAQRVAALHPASGVGTLLEYFRPVIWLASALEPALRQLCVGTVNPDIVPQDRLSIAVGPDYGSWRSACP